MIDAFLFWDAVLVVALTLADWLLGEKKRARIRERVGDFWVYVDDSTFIGLATDDARRVRLLLERVLGPRVFAARSLLSILAITLLLTGVVPTGGAVFEFTRAGLWGVAQSPLNYVVMMHGFPVVTIISTFLVVLTVTNTVFAWCSYAVAHWLLRMMERATTLSRLFAIASVDLVVSATLGVLSYWCAGATITLYEGKLLPPVLESLRKSLIPFATAIEKLRSGDLRLLEFALLAGIFIASLPILIHFCLVVAFMLSKLFRPVVRPVLGVVLLRFHDSEKGVLTQLALAVGVLAKLVQEGVKALG